MFDTVINWIALPLGYVMDWCYRLIGNYGAAIILFTLLSKIILLPISVWVQKSSIKMVEIQPELNRAKARHFGDADAIAEAQAALYKQKKYNPLSGLLPVAVQLILLMGVVGVIYNPLQHLFHLPADFIAALNTLASSLTGVSVDSSGIQLAAVEAIKDPANAGAFAALQAQFPSLDVATALESIRAFRLSFLGLDLSWTPRMVLGFTVAVPAVAGLSSWLLCVAQNKSNVLQAEQNKWNQYGTMAFSVLLSLYLGFFVPCGIALYWVASNLFAILQLYALNAVIPPKKYVDYEALEESRRELAELESLGGKGKDPYRKREKADYKRFFSIENKHIVFYSERSGFYKYYRDLISYLLQRTNLSIHYITNDPEDCIFAMAEKESRIKPYYISIKKLMPLMMRMDADMVVMTTPDLDNYYLKRSLVRKDVEYIFVPHDSASMHMGFREHSLDHFDTVFCTGPHIMQEVRASEAYYKTPQKTLVEFGYPLLEDLIDAYGAMEKQEHSRKQILIGPSWQEDNLLDSCIETLIDSLWGEEYRIIVRPHPEYMKRYKPRMDALMQKYADKLGEGLVFETDFSTNTSTYSSDLLITDWSGIGLEFCFATLKPALFINTKMKMENPNYGVIGIEPQEIRLRSLLGIALDKEELDKTTETVKLLLNKNVSGQIRAIRDAYFYHLGSHGEQGGEYIVQSLMSRKNKK